MTYDEYAKLPGVRWSELRSMARSPAHYRQAIMTPREDTAALKLGRCVHMAVLEPERFAKEVVFWDGGVRRGKRWDAFQEQHEGSEILKDDEYEQCLAIANAVRLHPVSGKYVSGGKSEVTVQWKHEEAALGETPALSMECKGRLDFVSDLGFIVDLKTARDASVDGFGKAAWNLRYGTQCCWYRDGYAKATGRELPVVLVAVESAPPYAVVVYRVPEIVLDLGREEYCALLRRLRECRETGRWPAYADCEMELSLPRWAAQSDDTNLADLGLEFAAQEA